MKSKKNFKKIVQMAIPLLILLGISLLEVNINELREEAINPKKPISSGYWEVDEYTISGNGGWETTNSTYDWCNGSGTWENPYIIENVTFRCLDGDGDSLRIESSDVYFIIRNCTFTSSGSHTYDAGIHLYQVGNGTLINNNCSFNNNYGIYINYSDNNTISGNTVNNNDLGIYLGDSDNNNVSGNTANHNSNYYGIYLYYSNSNTVSGNTANYNDYGIFLLHSDSNTVSGNIFDNNVDCGIYIGISDYNLIYKNYFINNGKHALDEGYSNDWNSSIIGNYWDNYMGYDDDLDGIGDTPHNFGTGIDNLPIWNFQSPIHIDDSPASPIDWAWAEVQPWCSGSGTFNNPYVIDGLNITARGVGNGILIENSYKYFIVQNCKLIESGSGGYDAGIRLDHVGNGTLINNNCSFNNKIGMYLYYSDNNTVSGNTANYNNYHGIYLWYSNNNTISGNTATNNSDYGIYLWYSNNNTVSGNTANDNQYSGIYLYLSNSTTVSGNTANDNTYDGINLWYSDNNAVSGNTATNNSDYGIHLYRSDNNTVSGNTANYNNYRGINLLYSNSTTVSGNTASNNQEIGIYLSHSDDNAVSGNTANNNEYGIYLLYSNSTTVSGNTASNNQEIGIYLSHSDDNAVSGNTASNNQEIGIYLLYSNDTTVSGNTASNNQDSGIYLSHSDSTTISGNFVDNNVNYGIIVSSESDYNLIYKNYFNDNNYMNALDNGKNNKWDNGVIGNYWDDYAGVDANDDGIGDTPYIISGTAGSQDNFPIWDDGVDISAPVITIILPLPDSVFGLVAPNYNISIDELSLDTIWYTLDGGITNYTITGLTGTFNQLAWEALSEGSVTIRFYANDSAGNIGFTDVEVIIEVPEDLDGVPIISFGNYYILFTFIAILSFIILEKRKNK